MKLYATRYKFCIHENCTLATLNCISHVMLGTPWLKWCEYIINTKRISHLGLE